MTESTRKARQFQTVGTEHIKSFLREHPEVTPAMLSAQWGLSKGCVGGWIREGKAPKWTILVIEGLRRRLRANNEQPTVLVIKVLPDKAKTIKDVLSAMSVDVTEV